MKSSPKVGSAQIKEMTVAPDHAIRFEELPPVLATPWLIWFLEHAALELLQPHLSEGELSVGVHVDIEHLAPALVGDVVTFRARLIHSEGTLFTFQVDAHCQSECLAKGLHKRRVVESAKLARRLKRPR